MTTFETRVLRRFFGGYVTCRWRRLPIKEVYNSYSSPNTECPKKCIHNLIQVFYGHNLKVEAKCNLPCSDILSKGPR